MLRTIRRAATLVAATAAVTLAAAGSAGADLVDYVDQMESATLVNLEDIRTATLDGDGDGGEGTCTNPVVSASPGTPGAYLVVGETYDSDVAQAVGHCVTYQGGSALATLSMRFEHQPYPGHPFVATEECPPSVTTRPAIVGVHLVLAPTAGCRYAPNSAAAGRPRRAHAVLTYFGRTYHGYSAVFPDVLRTG